MNYEDRKILNITLLVFSIMFYSISFIVPAESKFIFQAAGISINLFQVVLILIKG